MFVFFPPFSPCLSTIKHISLAYPFPLNPPLILSPCLLKPMALNLVFFCCSFISTLRTGYTSVRDKITDPNYSGWFLKSKPGGSLPNGSYHVSQCDDNYDPPLCSPLYHDKDQTPCVSDLLFFASFPHTPIVFLTPLFKFIPLPPLLSGFPHGDGSCPGPCDCGKGVPCG
jgi:hypothetical protein